MKTRAHTERKIELPLFTFTIFPSLIIVFAGCGFPENPLTKIKRKNVKDEKRPPHSLVNCAAS